MWIESHQTLRGHPKVRRAARLLDVPPAQVIGHLHLLWWWVLDHAFDGDVSAYDAMDLADAAEWDGDPDTFVKALTECGPGGTSGFIDADGPRLHVHDWAAYTEHLRIRRAAAVKANHDRWHVARGVTEPSCGLCRQPDSEGDPSGVPPESDRTADASDPESTEPNRTAPHPTEPTPPTDSSGGTPDPEVADVARELTRHFARAVKANGHKVPPRGTRAHGTWLKEMHRLLRIDSADAAEVRRVIDWCANDHGSGTYPGERVTVRSVPKFRERYSELRLKADHANGASPRPRIPDPADYSDHTPLTGGGQ